MFEVSGIEMPEPSLIRKRFPSRIGLPSLELKSKPDDEPEECSYLSRFEGGNSTHPRTDIGAPWGHSGAIDKFRSRSDNRISWGEYNGRGN